MKHARTLTLVVLGAALGGLATLALPRAGAQDPAPSALPEDLRGEVSLYQGEARLAGKITDVVELGGARFLRVQAEGGSVRYLRVDSVSVLAPGR